MFKPTLLIDFDLTISPVHGFFQPPKSEVVESIKKLSEKYSISIYSTRCNNLISQTEDFNGMVEYLKNYDIPYDSLCEHKPIFSAIIDDRSFNPKVQSWSEIVETLMNEVT